MPGPTANTLRRVTAVEGPRRGRRPALPPDVERKALLDAGLRVLRASGYDRASLDEILAEAGLATRAFYRHFASKDELLIAIFRRDAESGLRRLTKRVMATEASLDAFLAWLDGMLAITYDPVSAARTVLMSAHGASTAAGYLEERDRAVAAFAAPLADVLERGLADGTFVETQPEMDARTINAVVWSVMNRRDERPATAEAARDYVLRFCLPVLGVNAS